MSDPLAVLPLAVAAAGGRVDSYDVAQLVAAGLTLLRRAAPLVRALQGRRAAILLPTSPAFLTALAASEGRGAVLVNPLAAPREIAAQLADADVGAVFTNAALAARLPPDVPRALLDDAPHAARFEVGGDVRTVDLAAHAGDALDLAGDNTTLGRDEEAAVVYTSAMAGRPLGAVLTHRNLVANGRATVEAGGFTPLDHSLAVLPFSHLFGLVVSGVAPLLAGARVTTMDRFHPIRAVDLIAQHGVTAIVGVPAVFAALLQAVERRGGLAGGVLANGGLRLCICGGAPLAPELQERWHAVTGVELRQGYGLTEAGPVCLFNRVQRPNRVGTMGLPFPGVDVEVQDPDSGAECPPETVGEICVRGDNVGPGYVRGGTGAGGGGSSDPWAEGLQRRGPWLRTGDLGSADTEGYVTFRGVRKPMFTRNGFNIYPRELEAAVLELPGVQRVTVHAVPDPVREHDIALEVVGAVTEEEVKRWCAERLSAYKQPSTVIVSA